MLRLTESLARTRRSAIPLHPQAQALIEAREVLEASLPPLPERPPQVWRDARAAQLAAAAELDLGPPAHREERIEIPGAEGPREALAIWPGPGDDYPVLVWFHGGGWVLGTCDADAAALRLLSLVAECAVISVSYRLAPEHPFPAGLEDCLAATRWIAAHGDELGVDGSVLAVGGNSAGGNLAAVVAQQLHAEGGPPIAAQLLSCPVTDCDFERSSYRDYEEGYLLTREGMRWFFDHYLSGGGDPADPRVSPLRAADFGGLPPAHIVTAEFDPLRDEGDAYAERLREAGVEVTHRGQPGQVHAFFVQLGVLDDAEQAIAEAARSLTRAFQQARAG